MRTTAPRTARKQARSPTEAPAGGRVGLARELLVDAALELMHDGGLDALSTRRLAERLGVKSPALYWHVRSKDELLGLIADAICAQMELPSARLSFRVRLEKIAWEYRRVLTAYRDAPRLFGEQAPTGPHRMQLYDAAIGAFLDGGFETPEALAMATFYRNYLLGMIAEEARQSNPAQPGALRSTLALGVELSHLGSESRHYPHLHGAAQLLAKIEPEEIFRIGLKILLDGTDCRAREIARAKKVVRRPL